MSAPFISPSTRLQRHDSVTDKFKCHGNCRLCGYCVIIRAKDPEEVYADFIEEMYWFQKITKDYCGGR